MICDDCEQLKEQVESLEKLVEWYREKLASEEYRSNKQLYDSVV